MGWDWDPGQSGPHMLPGATEKQMSFWWQELGGWLSVSTAVRGRARCLEKRADTSFFSRLFHSKKAERADKGEPFCSSE